MGKTRTKEKKPRKDKNPKKPNKGKNQKKLKPNEMDN